VTLRWPSNGADPALPAALVDVRETSVPAGDKSVHWRSLTSYAVETAGFYIEVADIGEPLAMITFVAAATAATVTIK
jgi:hypothetical protein